MNAACGLSGPYDDDFWDDDLDRADPKGNTAGSGVATGGCFGCGGGTIGSAVTVGTVGSRA